MSSARPFSVLHAFTTDYRRPWEIEIEVYKDRFHNDETGERSGGALALEMGVEASSLEIDVY